MRLLILLCSLITSPTWASLNVEPLTKLIRLRSCGEDLKPLPNGAVLVVAGLGNDLVEKMGRAIRSHSQRFNESWLTYFAKNNEDALDFMSSVSSSSPQRIGLKVRFRVGGRFYVTPANKAGEKLVLIQPQYDISQAGFLIAKVNYEAKLRPQQIVAIVEDHSLPPKKVELEFGSRDGIKDQNEGLRSLNTYLQQDQYTRIRVGAVDDSKVNGLLILVNELQQLLTADQRTRPKVQERIDTILKELNR